MRRTILGIIRCVALAILWVHLIAFSDAQAAVFTGGYDPLTSFGSLTTGSGPYQLTSTDSTYSLLRRTFNENPTFANVTNLNVKFDSPIFNALETQALANAGGGGGAPRLSLGLDTNGDTVVDGGLIILIGTSPSFVDLPLALNAYSGVNLINNDPGRYDLSQFGGSAYTNYSAALSLLGSATVIRATLILDSFGGADKTLNVSSIDGEFNAAEATVPEPTSLALWGLGALGCAIAGYRRRKLAA